MMVSDIRLRAIALRNVLPLPVDVKCSTTEWHIAMLMPKATLPASITVLVSASVAPRW